MSTAGARVAIVGAGVIGLAIACRLVHEGHRVTLVDRDAPGRACSFGNAGHLATEQVLPLASPATLKAAHRYLLQRHGPLSVRAGYWPKALPWLLRFAWASRPAAFRRGVAALAELQQAAMPAFRRLVRLAGIEQLLATEGNLLLAETESARETMLGERALLEDCGVRSRWLEPEEVAALAGGVTPRIEGALHFTDTGHVADPCELSRGLLGCFRTQGGRFEHRDVRHVRAAPRGGFELEDGGEGLRCDRLVIAAGAWSGPLARDLGHRLPLDTERGYHLTAHGWHGDFRLPIASFERKTIMTPLAGGLRITGFIEFGGLALAPDDSRFARLEHHLRALLPDAGFPAFGRWMGCRPSLPDHLPVIAESHRHRGAFLAFGHQHLGLTLAGITAEIVADLARGREPAVDIGAFRADRFAGG